MRTSSIRAFLSGGLLLLAGAIPGFGASPNPLSGEILGQVKDAQGIVQMGASVWLYNRSDELVGRVLSNEQGRFVFAALIPDTYSLRVLLASFAPVVRRNITVLPSSENRLDIHLSSVISTVQFNGSPATVGTLMSDDWKWVLRSSQATRPIMRLLPDVGTSARVSPDTRLYPEGTPSDASSSSHSLPFSDTSGILQLSAGDGQSFARGAEQDLGTAFVLATSLAGAGRVQMSGNVGYTENSPLPAAGFRTSYTRSLDGSSPEFVVTARQIYLAPQSGSGINTRALRTLSAAFLDRLAVSERLVVDYGFDYQGVAYIRRLNNVSPFVRASYDAGRQGKIRAAASWGTHPTELLARDSERNGRLDQDLTVLAMLPEISRSGHRLAMERTENFEISYERVAGSRTYSTGIYDETVSNGAFMLSAPANFVPAGDLLPDLTSKNSIFNVGSYHRIGYTAAVKQSIGENAEISVAVGRTGALLADPRESSYSDSNELRNGLRQEQRNWVTLRASGIVPRARTRISANYGWTDFHVLMPAHMFVTQTSNQDIGVNVYVRQPLPISGMPWRVEAIAELRNLLAQGYLPLGSGGAQSVLTNSPRAVRGGFNFIF